MNWPRSAAIGLALIVLAVLGINAAAELICAAQHVAVCGG